MTSINAQPPAILPTSFGGRTGEKDLSQQRPDVKTVKFEKGPSVGTDKTDSPHQKIKISDNNISDGTENASDISESKKREQHLVFSHEAERLVWEELDPMSGKKQHFPPTQAARAYDKVQSQGSHNSPQTDQDLSDVLRQEQQKSIHL